MRSLERELAKETGQVSSVLVVGVCVFGGGGLLVHEGEAVAGYASAGGWGKCTEGG